MKNSSQKIAVILFNLGGPDKKESIKPFLFNFFMDKNIIQRSIIFRFFFAKFMSYARSKKEAAINYNALGNISPLFENSLKQAKALENVLNLEGSGTFKAFVSMRYWHPLAKEITKEVKEWQADQIFLLPLYPQFSTTTTKSSFENWGKECQKIKLNVPTTAICCYPWQEGFIDSSVNNIHEVYDKAKNQTKKNPRILFSAHGLPEEIIQTGDPYQWQCEQTVQKIIEKLGIKDLDWKICYQSRVGPLKWIGPSTEDLIIEAAIDQMPLVVYPFSFTQEHVETLVELDIEYRQKALECGLVDYYRVPTVSDYFVFIDGLAEMVIKNLNQEKILSHTGKRLCPSSFKECCME